MRPLAWAALPVIALAIGVQASGVGIDLLFVAVAGLFLLTLERTLGDWLADTIGVLPGTAAFALFVAGFAWYAIDSSDAFFTEAEKRGYQAVYYGQVESRPDGTDTSEDTASRPAGPRAAAVGGSTPTVRLATAGGQQSRSSGGTGATAEGTDPSASAKGAGSSLETAESSSPSNRTTVASRIFGSPKDPGSRLVTQTVVAVAPRQVLAARRAVLEAVVTAQGRPVSQGMVDFIVNGTAVARSQVDSRGVATAAFATHIIGTYEVRALFLGSVDHQSSSSVVRTLSVTGP